MRRKLYLSVLTCLFGILPLFAEPPAGTPVDEASSLTWNFETGAEGQTAVYSGETSVYYSIDDVEVGSNWSYAGAKNWRDPSGTTLDTFTGFTPVEKHSSPDATDYVMFNIRPNADLTFAPTTITFDCGRFGTSGGMFDVAWVSADGTETSVATGVVPARDKDANFATFTHTVIDVSSLSLPASAGNCKLKFYMYTLDPGKQVGIGNIIVDGNLSGIDITQTKVTDTPTLTWDFAAGTDDQVAVYSSASADFFNADNVEVGSNWTFAGAKNWRDPAGTTVDTFTGFTPGEKHSSPDATDYVMFNIRPKTALTFAPTTITFDCGRFGTGGGLFDVAWVSADGTETSVATGIVPARDKDANFATFTHTVIDVSSLSLPASVGNCKLKFYMYNLDPGKQVGIGNIIVDGSLSGFMSNIASYSLTSMASPDTAGTVSANLPGVEFDEGTELTLTATRGFGFEFSNWVDGSGNSISSDNPYTFTISQDTTINAVFTEINTYALDVTVVEGNDYMVTPSIEANIVDGKKMYEEGTVVTLTAAENSILSFTDWSTGETTTTLDVTMDGDKAITASYSAVDYIAGWDFYKTGNKDVIAPFSNDSNKMSTLVLRKDDASTSGWLDFSYESGNVWSNKNCAIKWTSLTDNYYFQVDIDATGLQNIAVQAEMLGSYNYYQMQNCEYSLDGTNWSTLGTYDLTTGGKTWVAGEFTLPEEANDADMVYIRWIPDYTSTALGSGNDGTSLTNIYVTGEAFVAGPMLVAHWKLDETSGMTLAEEINGADATIIGEGAEWVAGADGNALNLSNAADTISAVVDDSEATSSMNFTTESFTVSLLAKYDPEVGEQTLFIKGDNGSDGPNGNGNRFVVQSKAGELRFAIDDDATKTQLGVTPDEFKTNEWVHIVGVRNADTDSLYLYLNGEELGRKLDETGALDLDSMQVMIGNYQNKAGKTDGALDDIRVYKGALSAQTIMDMYNSYGIVYKPVGLAAYWKFDEGTGTDVSDEIGLSDAVLSNSVEATWTDGLKGGALDFSQKVDADSVVFATAPGDFAVDFDSTASFSISVLIKADINLDDEQSIISKGNPFADNGGWYHISIKQKAIRFMVWDDATQTMTSPAGVLPENFENNEWAHVVCVRDRAMDSVYVYLNGVLLDKAEDLTDNDIANDGDFFIGSVPEFSTQYGGALDELMIYNVALSPDSIMAMAIMYGLDPSVKGDVAYWSFDNDTEDVIVDEIGTSDGSVMDTVVHIDGHIGSAITFAGTADTSYVMVADNEVVDVDSTSFSISTVVKFDVDADASNEYQVLFKGGTGVETIKTWETFGKWYTIAFKQGELRFAIDDNVNKTQLGVDVSDILPADEWVSIIAVRDMGEDSVKLYLNGHLIGAMKDATNTNISTAGIPLIIGNNKNQTRAFNGGIDEIRMFDRALTAEEAMMIAYNYNLDKMLLKSNADINGITVNGVDITPFDMSQMTYTVIVPLGSTNIIVDAQLADADAMLSVVTDADSSVITITAQDGVTENKYTVYFDYVDGVSNNELDAAKVYIAGEQLIISSPTDVESVEVFDITGRLLLKEFGIGTEASIAIGVNIPKIVIVRLTGSNTTKTFKIRF